jgi:PPOX class probable FMN-dependent enzyme
MERMDVTTVAELEDLYGTPMPTSLRKEVDHLTPQYRAMVEASPFFALATVGPDGLDCSPRGDAAGFVEVADPRTLLVPDRRGNNRLDSLHNIVTDPRVALLFLIPGIGETLRVNGTARLVRDDALAARFAVRGKAPTLVISVTVGSVYFQCTKALVRSDLWNPEKFLDHVTVPTAGAIMAGIAAEAADEPGRDPVDVAAYDDAYAERVRTLLY